jgi:hypothetical protein
MGVASMLSYFTASRDSASGTDSMKPDFGQKLFGQIFTLELWTNLPTKTEDKVLGLWHKKAMSVNHYFVF